MDSEAPPAKKQKTPTAPEQKLVLYGYWRSSCSWRVRVALATKKLAYEYKAVHLVKDGGEQHKDDYTKLNSMRQAIPFQCIIVFFSSMSHTERSQVPTLMVGETALTQSMAILEYLEEVYPENALLPHDSGLTCMGSP